MRRVVAGAAAALFLAVALATPVLACTTAATPLPVALYRAASPVVVGVVEEVASDRLTVRVEVAYRGAVDRRVTLAPPGPVVGWCAFPYEPQPAVGSRVLLAVVDPAWWAWPGSMVWTIDPTGRIVTTDGVPWTGAPAPRTVAEALASMGIAGEVPPTSTAPAVDPAVGHSGLFAGIVAILVALVALCRRVVRPRRDARAGPVTRAAG